MVPQDFSWIENYKLKWLALVTWCCYFRIWGKYKNRWKLITQINNASMDYPFGLEARICYWFLPWHNSEIFKSCNIGIFQVSDSNFAVFFFVQKSSSLDDANQILFRWLTKLRYYISANTLKTIYYALFDSHMRLCMSNLGSESQ